MIADKIYPSLSYAPSPLRALDGGETKLFAQCEYANHPTVSGNKWWKLKYNLRQAFAEGHKKLLTFGGAYSNHIYATAHAARALGLASVGIIRGEETLPLNKTLSEAKACGMELSYVSRECYRQKTSSSFLKELARRHGDYHHMPEGGSNELGAQGCAEWGRALAETIDFDYLCLAVGTGGTIAGLSRGIGQDKKIIGVPVLKNAQFLEKEIAALGGQKNWRLVYDYHFGGYAKTTSALLDFMRNIYAVHRLPLDFAYTGKALWATYDLTRKGFFEKNATVLFLHTGGLQGVGI